MKGKKIKQINRLVIRYSEAHQYSVWTPDGKCWEDRLALEQAENFCRKNTDFVAYPVDAEDISYVERSRKRQLSDRDKLKIGVHMKHYGLKGVGICAWYEDWDDFCSEWCGIGYTRKQAKELLHGGKGEFMVLPDSEEIIRFAL